MTIVCRTGAITRDDQTDVPLELPLGDPLGADIATTYLELFEATVGSIDAGIWECDPGRFRVDWPENGEVIYLISGRVTLLEDGEDPVEIGPGAFVIFPVGWKGFWEITEAVKKVYVNFS